MTFDTARVASRPPSNPVGCLAENRPPATMAYHKRRLLMGLGFFFCLISRLLVLSFIFFENPPLNSFILLARRDTGLFDMSPPSGISELSFDSNFLSAPLLFCLCKSCCSFCLLVSAFGQSPAYFPEMSLSFLF